jgi:hypothetical protein
LGPRLLTSPNDRCFGSISRIELGDLAVLREPIAGHFFAFCRSLLLLAEFRNLHESFGRFP